VTEAVAKLAIFRRRRLQRLIELNDRLLKIGRGRQNDIVLDDPEQVVSRFHAELRPHGSGYVLVDLNSQNGTWVNAERIDRIQMRSGVPVEVGSYELVIEETRAS
jgi:pSer/pThr/pTyr-binding forkhead associated (FHA) protein